MHDPLARLAMDRIRKAFGSVVALDDVSFDCRAGEVHAIVGENGAGKSTLMRILGGVYRPDSGTIAIDGRPVSFTHPSQARRFGISIIHQELSLLPHRTVAENVFLGVEPARLGLLDRTAMRNGARALLARLSSQIDCDTLAADLSLAEQQIVEIAKSLALDVRILVMDEPTAALDDSDTNRLLGLVERLRAQGVAVVYVSHRFPEIGRIADRITVLKDGRRVATEVAAELPPAKAMRLMVGRPLSDFYPPRSVRPPAEELLSLRGCGNRKLDDVDLDVRRGEIVGIAGLEGSGKSELGRAIFGIDGFERGTMRVAGADYAPRSPREAVRAGVGYLPDDRKREGLLLQQSVRDNATLTMRALARVLARPAVGAMADVATDQRLQRLDVRAGDFGQPIRELSGGNQQKAIVARWLACGPALFVFAEPTRGIDVAAKAAIYRIMRGIADDGAAVVLISSELPEVIGVSDRIVVMRDGRVAGVCAGGSTEETVLALAIGHAPALAAEAAPLGATARAEGDVTSIDALTTATARRSLDRRRVPIPLLLLLGSLLLFVVTALLTGQSSQLSAAGSVGLAQRMVGLGLVALGQTIVILAGSIDLSVAPLISVAAVGASFLMQGQVANVPMAVTLVMATAVFVGAVNGLIVTKLAVNPFIATLGVGLILQGLLSATFSNFAGSVPESFQALAYGSIGPLPYSVVALFVLAACFAFMLKRTRFGAHLYAVGGNVDGARLAGVRTNRVRIGAHALCGAMAGLTGLYLASRLRSGAPWVGHDGVYDLESVAVAVIGGSLLAGGRGGVWGTMAGVLLFSTLDAVFNMTGVDAFSKQILRGAIVIAAVAVYAVRSRGLAA